MQLTKLGQIIDFQWNRIYEQHYDIQLDQYVIMPNHVHGILIKNM